jgi:hypothetical protein
MTSLVLDIEDSVEGFPSRPRADFPALNVTVQSGILRREAEDVTAGTMNVLKTLPDATEV